MKIKIPLTPWQPSCWVGGWLIHGDNLENPWIDGKHKQIEFMRDTNRQKYAAVKATSAIMRVMRK